MIKLIKHFYSALFLKRRLFFALSVIIVLFVLSFFFERILIYAQAAMLLVFALVVIDMGLLFGLKEGIVAQRQLPDKLSNGDDNPIEISIHNKYNMPIRLQVIEELPVQFQKRDLDWRLALHVGEEKKWRYTLKPKERGAYYFGATRVFALSPLALVAKRYTFDDQSMIPTYPSFIQLRKFELMAFSQRLKAYGLKKIRKIGHTMEFEQIKEYVTGDDIRTINWKATAKRNQLMINQYQDERSQPIYCLIDKGRVMRMPFDGLQLLDYAINASLVLANVALKKGDKAGMLTFSNDVQHRVVAQRRSAQLQLIMETLYAIDTDFKESDFARLYVDVKRKISQRSLLLLFTNFETIDAMQRQLPYLQRLSKNHLLVVIFFENTSLDGLATSTANGIREVYDKTIAQRFVFEKRRIVKELNANGIQALLTKPEELTVNTINTYLAIKARGLL